MKSFLVIERLSPIRFLALTFLFGLWGGLLAALVGYVAAAMLGAFLFPWMQNATLLSVQTWTIFGASHSVYYAVKRYSGSANYLATIAGGFIAGILLVLIWSGLAEGLNYVLLLAVPITGAMSGFIAADLIKPSR
jgi:hypothetical protein